MPIRFPQLPNLGSWLPPHDPIRRVLAALLEYLGQSNQQLTKQVQDIGDRDQATNVLTLGTTGGPTRVATDLTTPTLTDGCWWVEVSGTSPSRTASLKVRDGGVTRTIASVTY